jgi:hypothetical protein
VTSIVRRVTAAIVTGVAAFLTDPAESLPVEPLAARLAEEPRHAVRCAVAINAAITPTRATPFTAFTGFPTG